ncbi:Uncharacterised protein [Rhodococcus wratislaviensis]|uniref:Uncharacterized protein n=1 Tax=Rhodococcus wratislaviensis TaxID=44752 RepID=A0AB38F905_RHOWR|nr:Uncharacterised protein [Rhodococcus wratislaviensis]
MAATWAGVGVALPADHEPFGDGFRFVDSSLGDGGLVDAAGGLGDVGQGHDGGAGELFAGCVVVDVEEGLVSPDGGEHGQAGLDVDADVAGVYGQGERFGRGKSGAEAAVDEQGPHVAERDVLGDEFFDVDAAVAQGAAVLVGFGDVAGERDHTFQSADEISRYFVTWSVDKVGCSCLNGHGSPCVSVRRPAARSVVVAGRARSVSVL